MFSKKVVFVRVMSLCVILFDMLTSERTLVLKINFHMADVFHSNWCV